MKKKKEEEEFSPRNLLSSIHLVTLPTESTKPSESTSPWMNNISVVLSGDDLFRPSKSSKDSLTINKSINYHLTSSIFRLSHHIHKVKHFLIILQNFWNFIAIDLDLSILASSAAEWTREQLLIQTKLETYFIHLEKTKWSIRKSTSKHPLIVKPRFSMFLN